MQVSFYTNASDGLTHFKAVMDDGLTVVDRPAVLPDDQVAWPTAFDHFLHGGAPVQSGDSAMNQPTED